ncbi:MAG: hypothetical protein LQ350_006989 [Teloschistes chrysophthalmus]|nr:MAG: hypothetical protein LQ350_006989 [Niorma chrysophthalma]
MATAPEAPQPLRKQGYTYGLDGFTVNKIHRAEPARLRYLLLPQSIQGVRAKKAAEEEAKLANLQSSLQQAFEPRRLEYQKQSNEHRIAESTRVAREFDALGTPTAQAQYSIDTFLQRYFLDGNEKPEQSKTPEPVALPGFVNRAQMHAAVEHIPGLLSESGGDGSERTVVVGWRDTGVGRLVGQINREQRTKQEHTAKAAWDQLRRKHEDFAKASKTPHPNETFSFQNARGQYIIKCEAADSYNDLNQASKLRLRITEGDDGWYGIFDFGILSGIMLRGESPEEVKFRVQQQEVASRSDEGYSESDEEDDEGDSELDEESDEEDSELDEESDEEDSESGEESDEGDSESHDESDEQDISTKKRKAPPERSETQPSIRLKKSASPGGIIYLKWRSQETGENVIQVDPNNENINNENIGNLVFSDKTGMKFHGTASMSFLGSKVQGFKIGGLVGPITRSWDQYSEAAYERASVARWH